MIEKDYVYGVWQHTLLTKDAIRDGNDGEEWVIYKT